MKLTFRYNKNDYLELLLLKNNDNSVIKRSKLLHMLSIPWIIIIILVVVWNYIMPNYLPTLIIAVIFVVFWIVSSNSIYEHKQRKIYIKLADAEFANNIEYIRDTTITISDNGITREIEGMYSKFDWYFVDSVLVTNNNIFIKLISNGILNIPKRIFNSADEEGLLLKYIDERMNINNKIDFNDECL